MSKDKSKQYQLGPCNITLGATNLGYFDEEGVVANIAYKELPANVSDFGGVPLDMFISVERVEIDVLLTQTEVAALALLFPHMNKVTNTAGLSKLQFGFYSGKKLTSAALVITPVDAAIAAIAALSIYRVVPVGEMKIEYDGKGNKKWKVKLLALADDSKSDGNWIGTFGDTTIVADSTAPTVSSVAPTDGQTGQSATVNVVWTMSESMDPGTINDDPANPTRSRSCLLMKNPVGVGTPTALGVPCVVTYDDSAKTITLNPDSSLTSGATYIAMLLTDLKDVAGNRLGGGSVGGQVAYSTEFVIT